MDHMKMTLTQEETEQIEGFFQQFDQDDNGMLGPDELERMFENFNVSASKDDLVVFFERVDTDGDGK